MNLRSSVHLWRRIKVLFITAQPWIYHGHRLDIRTFSVCAKHVNYNDKCLTQSSGWHGLHQDNIPTQYDVIIHCPVKEIFGYSLEPRPWGSSSGFQKYMFSAKTDNIYFDKPHFSLYEMRCSGMVVGVLMKWLLYFNNKYIKKKNMWWTYKHLFCTVIENISLYNELFTSNHRVGELYTNEKLLGDFNLKYWKRRK